MLRLLLILLSLNVQFLGGATACVAAGRLIAADPHLKVLVIIALSIRATGGTNDLQILEAGPHTQDVKQHVQPAKYRTHLDPNSKTVTFNQAKPSPSLLGKAPIVPCGHAVGGGSSVNCKSSYISLNDLLT